MIHAQASQVFRDQISGQGNVLVEKSHEIVRLYYLLYPCRCLHQDKLMTEARKQLLRL